MSATSSSIFEWSSGKQGNITDLKSKDRPKKFARTFGGRSTVYTNFASIVDRLRRTTTLPGMTSRVSECITCKRQFTSEKDFCACHRKLTPVIDGHKSQLKSSPVKARPGSSSSFPDPTRSNLSGGGTSTMPNHSSSGEVVGIEMEGMHSPGCIHLDHAGGATLPNVSNESTSEPSQPDLFNRDHGEPNRALNVPSKDTDVKMRGMPSSDRVQGGPTVVLRGDSSSPGFADEEGDIETGRTHSSDGDPSEQRPVGSSSNDPAHEDTRWRSATMLDLLITVSVQGACSLVAYNGSDGSSPAKDVLFFLVVFSFVLGFLSAVVGKLYRGSKMVVPKVAVIGWVATAVGFLLTMALVVICKI